MSMNAPSPDSVQSTTKSSGKAVLCAKCEHLNPAERRECGACGSRLYVTCRRCGESNQRVASRCTSCGHRLHRSWLKSRLKKLEKKVFGRRPKITLWQIILLVVAVYATYKIIIRIVEYEAPPPA